ncbi:ABC transporter permease [Listeria booriae]|uniref:ABC transporter permease n=1 Tax=Listeria booriae TaxID=1552123 RepID=UPI001623F180|nr:ABC-2 family transporter protein [Listeria booriae]MBC1512038.1 hypothetical protein [Listeria booriae]MBC6150850.1 hypothetical protein [Listeria booriae]MBC6305084.1 hypothetical protein [Listeria booriae]
MSSVQLYFKIIKTQIRAQLEYQTNAIFGFLNQFIVIFFEFIAVWSLLDRFGGIDGWTLGEVFLTYGIVNFSFSMAEVTMRGFESNMAALIRNGDYDRYLLRPRNTIMQISAFSFQFIRLGRAFQSILVLFAGIYLNFSAFDLQTSCLLVFTLIGGILLYLSLYILIGIMSFKFLQNTEFMSIFIQGSVSTMQYPKTIFPKWIQNLFTYILPVTAVTYYPLATIFSKTTGTEYMVGYFSPAICFIFFGAVVLFFHRVEKKYISSGS